MAKKSLCLTVTLIQRYAGHLCDQERSAATIQKYVHDLTALSTFLDGRPMTKGLLLEWKEGLIGRYAPASVNAMLAAVNRFLTFLGRNDLRLRPLKIQRALFLPADKELTRAEYIRLVRAAQSRDNQRLALVLQTICATGIRAVSCALSPPRLSRQAEPRWSTRESAALCFCRRSCAAC